MKSQSFQISSSLFASTDFSYSPLIRDPFIRVKVLEAKDVYLMQGTRRDVGDLYARISYETEISQKTNVVPQSSSPKWNSTSEFEYFLEDGQEGNYVSISIYDADPLGSDELLATQFIYLPYFKQKKPGDRVIDFWLKLDPVNFGAAEEQILINTGDASIYQDLNLANFEDAIVKDKAEFDDDRVPKLHVSLEFFDPVTIKHFNVSIPEVEETRENGLLECKVFVYTIKIVRNDGLEWYVKKRYSEIRALRQALSERSKTVKSMPFPEKTMLKFTSKIFSGLDREYLKVCEERKDLLEKFLKKIVSMSRLYNAREFNKFFSVHDRQF